MMKIVKNNLTMDEWRTLWDYVKRIERLALSLDYASMKRARIIAEVNRMKELIQLVTGPME